MKDNSSSGSVKREKDFDRDAERTRLKETQEFLFGSEKDDFFYEVVKNRPDEGEDLSDSFSHPENDPSGVVIEYPDGHKEFIPCRKQD